MDYLLPAFFCRGPGCSDGPSSRGPLPTSYLVDASVTSQGSSSAPVETFLELLGHSALYFNYLCKNRNGLLIFIPVSLAGNLACCRYVEMFRKWKEGGIRNKSEGINGKS